MELIKPIWNQKDITEFNQYLENRKREDKIDFAKRTIPTKMKILGIPTPEMRKIAKEIGKGNAISFLDHFDQDSYESTMIHVFLINSIDEIETKKYYLSKLTIDNWATVDAMTFKIKGKEKQYLDLAKEYIKSEKVFFRRIGVRILFHYTELEDLSEIFQIIDSLYEEKEYYVNMAVAWLMCEILIKNRENAFSYLNHHHLNPFTIHKTISKCRDSYRVSKEDKDILLKYRMK